MTDEAAFTATIKAGTGYDAPWIVIRANTGDELKRLLREAHDGLSVPLTLTAQVFQADWSGVEKPAPAMANNHGYQQPAQAAAPQAPANPVATAAQALGGAPMCVHGTMKWVTAKEGSGKDWKGWFCPQPREATDKCKPQFVK